VSELEMIKKEMSENRKLLLKEMQLINQKLDALDARLTQHIEFIEKVYAPLQNSIDKFKRWFK
jgi:hypothetical protein